MAIRIRTVKRVSKTPENPHGCREVNPRAEKIIRPVVFCVSGDGTLKPRQANAMGKYAEQLLGVVGRPPEEREFDIVSAYYDNVERPQEMYNSREYYQNPQDKPAAYTEDEKNPPYVSELYENYFSQLIFDENKRPLPLPEIRSNLRQVNFLTFCHGHFVVAKLADLMHQKMVEGGYSPRNADIALKQMSCTAIVPQARVKDSRLSENAFGAIDDYHFSTEDALTVTEHYELDCNTHSYIGIAKRPQESRPGSASLYILDNMLDYYSEEGRFNVWLGRQTEEMHKVASYIEFDYSNGYGTKSEEGRDFARMIAKSLQSGVSNSCYNQGHKPFKAFDVSDIAGSSPLFYQYGPEELNAGYQNLNVAGLCKSAELKGKKIDDSVYRQMHMQQMHRYIEEQGIDYVLEHSAPYWKAYAVLEANLRGLPVISPLREEDKKFIDNEMLEYIKMSAPAQEGQNPLHKSLQRKLAAQKYVELSGLELDISAFEKEAALARLQVQRQNRSR